MDTKQGLNEQCTVHTQYTVYSLKCTVESVQFTVHSEQFAVYSVQCTVHSAVHSVQYNELEGRTFPCITVLFYPAEDKYLAPYVRSYVRLFNRIFVRLVVLCWVEG